MKIAVGMVMQETNSFSTIKTDVIEILAQSQRPDRFPKVPS